MGNESSIVDYGMDDSRLATEILNDSALVVNRRQSNTHGNTPSLLTGINQYTQPIGGGHQLSPGLSDEQTLMLSGVNKVRQRIKSNQPAPGGGA